MREKNCVVCPYYLRRSSYCALLGVKVRDPLKPPCLTESALLPEVKPMTEVVRPQAGAGSEREPPAASRKQPVKKNSAALAVALILLILLVLSNATWYFEYLRLSTEYTNLVNRYQDLISNYYTLLSNYNDLKRNFDFLNKSYSSLFFEHAKLMREYDSLLSGYASLKDKSIKTSSSLLSLLNELELLAYIPDAFKRVLNWKAVEAIGKYVNESGVNPWDYWGSIQKIYDYIRAKVRYTYDVEIPVPNPPLPPNADEELLLGGWSYTMRRDYVQTPEFTIKYGQGDCDDQAVLAYAMIKYYMIRVHGREYALYIAEIVFSNVSHLAVFLPVRGGGLTIVDPAGSYLTVDSRGRICSRPASVELQRYRDWWSSGNYQIKRIELYSVDVKTGSYEQVASGTLEEIAAFLSKS
jgi:hypothetical protein